MSMSDDRIAKSEGGPDNGDEEDEKAEESDEQPATRKDPNEIDIDVLGGGETPAEFSEDDDDHPRNKALNKQALLEWVTIADFTKEISLTKIAHHKYKLEPEEI